MANLNVNPGENEKQYIWRIGTLIEADSEISWDDVAEVVNDNFRESGRRVIGDTCSKNYTAMKVIANSDVFGNKSAMEDIINELKAEKASIIKERQELHDERIALNKENRENSRFVTLADRLKDAIADMDFNPYDYEPNPVQFGGESDLIIHLTDVHCGNYTNSPFNTYSEDIVKVRLNKYLDNIYSIKNTHFAQDANLILGGDLIQGLIHVNSRIEAKEDIVTQIIYASEYISDFIKTLSGWFNNVNIYSVVGNHGRAVADKESAIRKENFDRLVTYICSEKLSNYVNVHFNENTLDNDIANFKVRSWNVWATHGDKDTPHAIVNNFTNFARFTKIDPPDVCYLGHRHCNGLTTVAGIKVVESGSTMGMDSYCVGRRLCGHPEQTVTVVTDEKAVAALYDITLD